MRRASVSYSRRERRLDGPRAGSPHGAAISRQPDRTRLGAAALKLRYMATRDEAAAGTRPAGNRLSRHPYRSRRPRTPAVCRPLAGSPRSRQELRDCTEERAARRSKRRWTPARRSEAHAAARCRQPRRERQAPAGRSERTDRPCARNSTYSADRLRTQQLLQGRSPLPAGGSSRPGDSGAATISGNIARLIAAHRGKVTAICCTGFCGVPTRTLARQQPKYLRSRSSWICPRRGQHSRSVRCRSAPASTWTLKRAMASEMVATRQPACDAGKARPLARLCRRASRRQAGPPGRA